MIKNILFDFDGVILDSMKIKGDGFVELFKEYDDLSLKLIEKYHYENGGVSRFEKIKYFYNTLLNKEISQEDVLICADKFSQIIEKQIFNKNNLIRETIYFIEKNYKKYRFHIVSGSEHHELNKLCINFDLKEYFLSIEGSPTKKDILVKKLLEKYNYKKEETILIGDAKSDYNASRLNGIVFYGYNNPELKRLNNYIKNFKEFYL